MTVDSNSALELALSPVDYSNNDSDLSDSVGPCATIMDLKDDPHLDCCIPRPGELGNPLGGRTAERLSGVVYPGEEPDSPDMSGCN